MGSLHGLEKPTRLRKLATLGCDRAPDPPLEGLTRLELFGMPPDGNGLAFLSSADSLETLRLDCDTLTDIGVLARLPALRDLAPPGCRDLDDCEPLLAVPSPAARRTAQLPRVPAGEVRPARPAFPEPAERGVEVAR